MNNEIAVKDASEQDAPSQRSRRPRSRRNKKKRSLAGFWRRLRSGVLNPLLSRLQNSAWLCAIPMVLLLSITPTDFLVLTHVSDVTRSLFFEKMPVPYNDDRRDVAEALKVETLQFVYLFLFVVCALRWRQITGYLMKWPHLVVLVAYLLVGVFYSIVPIKVVTNSMLILIGFLASILFATAYSKPGHYDGFFHVVFWPMMVINAGSLIVLTLYEVNIIDLFQSPQRYGGLAGNPNSLGATAVLGVWAGASILLSSNSSRIMKILACLGLLLLFFTTALSGSGTSIATILVVIFALAWLRILAAFRPKVRTILNGSMVLIGVFVVLYGLLLTTPAQLYLSLTSSLGKDVTLTGRTQLWAIARDAISLKPWLGWGFDSHQSVMAERAFSLSWTHYHNGFLDTIIAGGVILLLLVLYNLFRFCQVFLQTFRQDANAFSLALPFFILLMMNISEYSLLRPNSELWLVYFLAFAMLTYDPQVDVSLKFKLGGQASRSLESRSSGRRKKGEKLRWG